jgi:inhibitor of cysteine peptidase
LTYMSTPDRARYTQAGLEGPGTVMTPVERMLSGFMVVGAMLATGMMALTWSDDPASSYIDDGSIFSRFASMRDLNEFLEDTQGNQWYRYGEAAPMLESRESYSGTDYSRTNVQVAGIDELDTVKTDGRNIYVATEGGISIVQAYPPEQMSNLSFLSKEDVAPYAPDNASLSFDGLFVLQNRLIIIASWYERHYWYDFAVLDSVSYSSPSSSWSTLSVFDINDAANPELVYTAGVTGWTSGARLVGDTVYLIAQQSAYIMEDEAVLPMVSADGADTEIPLGEIRYDPEMTDANAFTNILAVDIEDLEQKVLSIVTGYSSTIYVSPEAIYLTAEKYPEVTAMMDAEATSEVETSRTTIYRISYENLVMGATAKGEVRGTLLNQFSMDEHGSYLRVATNLGWNDRTNSVYVLDSDLEIVGALEGIAPDERIYSSRFIESTLYLVTFRQMDPLFVIDISDPANPRVASELTLPGFSTYLHPVDSDHLIGIGSENGTAKVTMFDVSDPAKPIEQSTWMLSGYHWSSTVWDHKQVLFDAEKNLLVLPITAYNWSDYYDTTSTFNAAFVFNVTADNGVELKGCIEMNGTGYYGWGIRRSLYIGEYLYTVWGTTVKVNLISDLSDAGSLVFFDQPQSYDRVMI